MASVASPLRAAPEASRYPVLVSTEWVAGCIGDPRLRIVEVDVDTSAYAQGHIPGAVGWNWTTDLCDPVVRDIIPKQALESLLGAAGITNDTTVVLYGDNHNWFAAWAFWQLAMYGHPKLRLMDGGRQKWIEEGRALSRDALPVPRGRYFAQKPNYATRAFRPEVEQALGQPDTVLIDVRSPQEFTGELASPPGLAETCQRAGHLPGAKNIPWSRACNDDGTFKSREELAALYAAAGATPEANIITYCRIGERSSHTWFVLTQLLGYPNVRNYDGSWTEWGNLVGAPVERGGG